MRNKKLLTIDDLVRFCQDNKFYNFSAKTSGYQLAVQVPSIFEVDDENKDNTLLFCKVKLYHIGENRNHSSVTKEAAEKSLSTIAYKPLLANFCEINGVKDFTSHDMTINEDGSVNYIERQIGCFTSDTPEIRHDEETDKDFVYARVAIPRDYTDACEIIERKNGTKVSVELLVNEMSYSVEDKVLQLDDIVVSGATCLGKNPETGENVEEGMKGARLDIESFSNTNNSIVNSFSVDVNTRLVEILDKLDNTLSNFNKNNTEKGVRREMNHFEELLEKYGFTTEELDFDYENMSDEQLDAAFEEFKNKKYADDDGDTGSDTSDAGETDPGTNEGEDPEPTDPQPTEPEPSEDDDPEDGEDTSTEDDESKKKGENFVKTFKIEISHEDIRYALYNLLGEYEEADNEWYGIYAVYDNYFIMQGWCNGKFYKQGYSIDGENVSLEGERTELFQMLLTESEKIAVDKLRGDYAELETKYNELKTFKDNYEAAEQKAAKDAIFADEAYDSIRESDEFKTLVNDSKKYSVEEIQNKCDLLFAASVKKAQFAAKDKKSHSLGFNFSKKEDKKASAYGNLFKKD